VGLSMMACTVGNLEGPLWQQKRMMEYAFPPN
jgi:hypothetical protein